MNLSSPRRSPIAAAFVAVLLGSTLTITPAEAATYTITLGSSAAASPPGVKVKFTGKVTGPAAGGKSISLRRQQGSGPWVPYRTAKVGAAGAYAFTVVAAVGAYNYKTVVVTSHSPVKTVTGTYARNLTTTEAGQPFTLVGQLPTEVARAVNAQALVNGSWLIRRTTRSSASGLAAARLALPAGTTGVRLQAPAASGHPAWAGPTLPVTLGFDPVIQRILDDTNAFRASQGKPQLTRHPALNTIAGDWAHHMHQSCTFAHRPSFWTQYPPGWAGAAENIAAGQAPDTVVDAWINSPGHRANLLGDYNRIGIGYFHGNNCHKRYYVQNFAKYPTNP